MDNTEIEDFKKILHRYGYSEHDFSLDDKPLTNWDPNGLSLIKGRITIKRNSTNKTRSYDYHGTSTWLNDFETDLQQKQFD